MKPNLQEIIELSQVHPLKIRNVYVFGSRVYGTHREYSDWDILMTACGLLPHVEIKDPEYNIHIITPDKFEADLKLHDIHNLECIFAPDWAKLQIKVHPEEKFKLDLGKLQRYVHNQSYNSWQQAKDRIQRFDTERGLKTMFHSLRMLQFGVQIAKFGKIIDFAAANDVYQQLMMKNEVRYNPRGILEWEPLRNEYLPLKIKLETQLKTYL